MAALAPGASHAVQPASCAGLRSHSHLQETRAAACGLRIAPFEPPQLRTADTAGTAERKRPSEIHAGDFDQRRASISQTKQPLPFQAREQSKWPRVDEDVGAGSSFPPPDEVEIGLVTSETQNYESSLEMNSLLVQECCETRNLAEARRLHSRIVSAGHETNGNLGSAIVDMFLKCGSMHDAHCVFDRLLQRTEICWTGLISAYAKCGQSHEALALYEQMLEAGISPNVGTYTAVFKACSGLRDVGYGKRVHREVINRGLEADRFVGPAVVGMYAKNGHLAEVYEVFNRCPQGNITLLIMMMGELADSGYGKEALELYDRVKQQGLEPSIHLTETVDALDLLVQDGYYVNSYVLYLVLKRCIAQRNLVLGQRVHALSVKSGYESSRFLANHIMRMYASHGRLHEATQVFATVSAPDTFMWNSIITAYAEHGQPVQAIKLYLQMRQSTLEPNSYVFVAVLKACAGAGDLASGRKVHADILQSAGEQDAFVESCLVDMYAKCGSLQDARLVFDNLPKKNVVTWTALITGYVKHGLGEEAFILYASMQQDNTTSANNVTFVCLLQACISLGWLHQGKQLHEEIKERGLEGDVVVGSSLVDMYAKCGSLVDARRVFDNLPIRNVVTWNAMIAGCVQHGLAQEALSLYGCMQQEGISRPDHFTFSCLLQACAIVGAVHQGKQLHSQIRERGLESDVVVGSCLVEMYAKCGSLHDAQNVVDRLAPGDVVTWTALLNGYAESSDGNKAIQCFEEMRRQGVQPNSVTFLCLLVACSHAGLVKEGQRYFKEMVDCNIVPNVQHYNCMVDLLGRSGCLSEAERILLSMPFPADIVGCISLLSACKSHGDIDCGRRCFDRIMQLEPGNASAYVLLGNIYANAGRWEDVGKLESLRKSAGAKKKAAKACIEVRNKVHEFTVGEERAEGSIEFRRMNSRLKEGGHVPQTELVLKAVPHSVKEDALCGHAEKLALAYGLINTPDGTTLLVTKNLRMCNDCHSSTKVMSRLEKREIIVRDGHRVHRFTNGFCSCGDRH